jgi:L(+)-tartrate dehydratase beta subunit
LLAQQNAEINKRIEMLYEGLKTPALRRYGETDNKTEELIWFAADRLVRIR